MFTHTKRANWFSCYDWLYGRFLDLAGDPCRLAHGLARKPEEMMTQTINDCKCGKPAHLKSIQNDNEHLHGEEAADALGLPDWAREAAGLKKRKS